MRYHASSIKCQAVLILIVALFGCQKTELSRSKEAQVIPVKVMRVELKSLYEILEYVGNIKAQDEAIVYPKVTGKIIQKTKEDGSAINKGEPLAYIDRDEVGLKFESAPVESPLTGVVGRVYVDIGSNVNPQVPVALIVNMDRVKINLDIPEKYLPAVSLGQEAGIIVDAYPQEEFIGKVTKASPVIDLSTRTAPVEITVDNPEHRLNSGMFARVKLRIQEYKNIPVVLKEAVMGKEPDFYVYIIENNKAILKKISLGIRQEAYYGVKEGLKENDLVVIMGQQRLYEGAGVKLEETK